MIKFLFTDGFNFKIREGDSVDNVLVLAVIGVFHNRFKTVLGIQSGDKESASSWGEFFKNLKLYVWESWTDCRVWKQSSKKNLLTPRLNDARSMKHVMCWLKFLKSLKQKPLMKYFLSSMLPPKRKPNSFQRL